MTRKKLTRIPFLGSFTYDPEADAAYIYLDNRTKRKPRGRTLEVTRDIYVDIASDGRLIGIELLGKHLLSKRLAEWVEQQQSEELE